MYDFSLDLQFTQVYKDHLGDGRAIREAHCIRFLMPKLFDEIQEQDRFAGRIHYKLVGFGLEDASGGPGFYCHEEPEYRLKEIMAELPEEEKAPVEDMIQFWREHATVNGILIPSLPEDTLKATSNRIASMGGRLAGALLDFGKLVTLGIPELRDEIANGREKNGDVPLYTAMEMGLDLLAEVCLNYAAEARDKANSAADELREIELLAMADALEFIAENKPETFRQATQLAWLYALISGVVNYGRMDVYLGDFLANDIDAGVLNEADALSMLQSLWQMMADRKIIFNGRVFLGGVGRPNVENADRFAMLAMEATRTVIEIEPQLTLRISDGMNPMLWEKALDVIGEGRTFPMLFNDDINVPSVMKGFNVDYETATQYLPYGCGEYALNGLSFGSPNCGFNILKALEATLHEGGNALTGEKDLGLNLGTLDDFKTYDDLWEAYKKQIEFHTNHLATRHSYEYKAEDESAGFIFISMLFADCIERGKSVVGGGIRYQGGIIETFGMVNAADSLATIKKLVYDEQRITLPELVEALDADFEGYEDVYQMIQSVDKYGNDNDEVDQIVAQVSDHVSRYTFSQAEGIGFHYFLIVNINNKGNVEMGKQTAASADGRRKGAPLANGNTPTAGNDHCGVTAFLNSIVKPDPSYQAGYTHNMKFNPKMFKEERAKLDALLKTYFACNGTQSMITVVSRGDLERAMEEPEKYRNLIVRVGGFSARFVELDRSVQLDLLARTLY